MSAILKMNKSEAEFYSALQREIRLWSCFEEDLQDQYDALQEKYEKSGWLLQIYRHCAGRLLAFDIGQCYIARRRLDIEKARFLVQLEERGA